MIKTANRADGKRKHAGKCKKYEREHSVTPQITWKHNLKQSSYIKKSANTDINIRW